MSFPQDLLAVFVPSTFFRDHHRSDYDHADGERPLFPPPSLGHQGAGCLLLDLLRVCVRCAHRVRLRTLQRRLQAQGKGQSEGQQAELRGEETTRAAVIAGGLDE